ncbi:fibrinogen silencer-binding protein isoform X2 [Tachysurus fulvidraco]|nr:fibrinogen silencer-binding protein isoform X2 [Tachysurus fulvidraco]XP_026989810.1 fibrinogen silencer-binding protein isoform X2 [Tachysurus fulvidraco]XP_026989811.1 fibrinogen silencer-binding protein isoform X2 [Tachysurus fulvidraco]
MKMLTTMTYRMPNFTVEQKLYLLQKIHSVVDAVQDFRKDTNTTVYRNAVWAELAQAFNDAFPNRPPSSVGSLKTLWKRLKVECRVALQRRQEQQAAGMPLTALTQVQREVMALVPNLITNIEDIDGDGSCALVTNSSPGPVTGGSNGNEQEDPDQNNEADSKELVAIDLGLVSPAEPPQNSGTPPGSASSPPSQIFFSHSSTSRGTQQRSSVFYPSQSRAASGSGSRSASTDPPRRVLSVPQVTPSASLENSFLFSDSHGLDSGWEARRQEALEREHQQTMSLLLLQQCVWEEKRRAARQKEKAARAKKHYYQAKLHKLGVEVQLSSSDSDDGGEHPQTEH